MKPNTNAMYEQMVNNLKDTLNELPPLMKYPVMLLLLGALKEELPAAEKEYAEEKQRMMDSVVEMLAKYAPGKD